MLVKAVIILFLVTILYSLGSAFISMLRNRDEGERTLRRLQLRIGLSLFLLMLLFVMFQLGWIEPSGGPIRYGAGG